MKLYNEHNPAPNPRRVRIFLAEKSISIPFVHVPMRQGAHKSAEFMLKNSLGQVPVLELDDASTLSEDYGEASRVRSVKALHWLNDELKEREFLATDYFSMADIVALTTIDFATFIGIETPAELTYLHAWHARVSARPSAAA